MKSSFVLVAAGLTTLICGCASTVPPSYNAYDRVDSDKIAFVNNHAKNNGIDVYWVNYPQRKPSDTAPAVAPVLPTGT